ncbi:outer dense fiber protein 3-like isoform X2 [Paramacrobiotus metropolitanus]|uniref:outer dense fiber protein 3-like isoform X2 n=1 Tax=Paramacrobiotus metropolitanus TaxID=2943436 RepID=UPI00244562D9|nr:outer dense fiber protein 3-like isoform X2 [Paramacrobiotus metropolitanus]
MPPAAELTVKPSYPIAAKLKGPGPGTYLLPSAIGWRNHNPTLKRCPAYTFRMLLTIKSKGTSPGPQYGFSPKLTNRGIVHAPAFSMGARLPEARGDNVRSPAWHMALPALKDKPNSNPAPNVYEIPYITGTKHPCFTDTPRFTMRIKPLIGGFTQDFTKTPGSAAYTAVNLEKIKQRSPAYTMQDRRPLPMGFHVPGPAAYTPSMMNKPRYPSYSLASKHSPYTTPYKENNPDLALHWDY